MLSFSATNTFKMSRQQRERITPMSETREWQAAEHLVAAVEDYRRAVAESVRKNPERVSDEMRVCELRIVDAACLWEQWRRGEVSSESSIASPLGEIGRASCRERV